MVDDQEQIKALEAARLLVHECLALNPVIVLGSGASAGFGLPTMAQLATRIAEGVAKASLSLEDQSKWKILQSAIAAGRGLEPALDESNLDERSPLYVTIVDSVWREVAWRDIVAFEGMLAGRELPHAKLFRYLFGSSIRRVTVITPNYDRLAEYGSDQAGFCHRTGFSNGYRRYWRGADRSLRFFRSDFKPDERIIDVLKVHGSVDWFANGQDELFALPVAARTQNALGMPAGMRPLIVPPNKDKYRQAFRDPFRSLVGEADRALKSAEAFFCVGYGFNDEHIQTYLVDSLRHRSKPLVMVTHTVTPKAVLAIKQAAKGLSYCLLSAVLDRSGEVVNGKSRIATHEYSDGVEVEGADLWSFDGFAREFL